MALRRTLGEMIGLVRSQADQEDNLFVLDSEITNWINQGIADFWRQMTRANPDWYILEYTLTTTAGTFEYNLYSLIPAFALMRGIDLVVNSTRRVSLKPYQFQERNQRRGLPTAAFTAQPRYRVARNAVDGAGSTLFFDSDPGNNSYILHYVPSPTRLLLNADNFDGVMGFEDWPVHYAVLKCREKAEEETALAEKRLAELQADVDDIARHRQLDVGAHIAKTRRRNRGGPYDDDEQDWF